MSKHGGSVDAVAQPGSPASPASAEADASYPFASASPPSVVEFRLDADRRVRIRTEHGSTHLLSRKRSDQFLLTLINAKVINDAALLRPGRFVAVVLPDRLVFAKELDRA